MLTNRLSRRTARISSRGGFTLVELLVVIGIIAILAGVALGPITNGIRKAKQSGGMQTTRTIAVAEFAFSNDNNGSYPDTANQLGGSSTGAAAVAAPLVSGGYTTDPTIYYISGDSNAAKYSGTATIVVGQISFDFAGNTGAGVNSNFPDACPVCWSSVAATGGTEPVLTTSAGSPITCIPGTTSPFGQIGGGVAVAYKSNSSKFVIYNNTTSNCTMVDSSWAGGIPSATVLKGNG